MSQSNFILSSAATIATVFSKYFSSLFIIIDHLLCSVIGLLFILLIILNFLIIQHKKQQLQRHYLLQKCSRFIKTVVDKHHAEKAKREELEAENELLRMEMADFE